MNDFSTLINKVKVLETEGRISDAVTLLESFLAQESKAGDDAERIQAMAKMAHLFIRQNRYQGAYKISFDLMKKVGVDPDKSYRSYAVGLAFLFLYRLNLYRLVSLLKKFYVLRLPWLENTNWEQANAILWGVYWQDLRLAMRWNVWSFCLAENEKERLRSLAFLSYTASLRGHVHLGLPMLRKIIKQTEEKNYLDLTKDLTLWLAVACQWAGLYKESVEIYSEFENRFPTAEPFLKIISYAGRLHLSFCEAGPVEVDDALVQCFAASFALKESRNHIQIYGAKAALLALEGKISEAMVYLEKSAKAVEQNNNNLDRFIGNRFAAVTQLNAGNIEKAKSYFALADQALTMFGRPEGYKLEMKRIAILMEMAKESSYVVRLKLALTYIVCACLSLQLIRVQYALRFSIRILQEKKPYFWSPDLVVGFFKHLAKRHDATGLRIDRNALSLRFAQSFSEGTQKLLDANNTTEVADEILRAAIPEVLTVVDGATLEECFERVRAQVTPRETAMFNRNDDRLLVPCLGGIYFIAVQLPMLGVEGSATRAKGVLLSGLDLDSQDILEAGLRLVLSYEIAIDGLKSSRNDFARSQKNAAIALATQMLAHDVRKPFSLIQGVCTLLRYAQSPEEINGIIEDAVPEVERAVRGVNGMLQDVVEVGSVALPTTEPSDLVSIVNSSLSEVFSILPQSAVKLEYEFNHTALLNVDSLKIARVLTNIIQNANQAMNGQGTIKFSSKERVVKGQNLCEVVVTNTGPHIPDEDIAKLFDAFFTKNKKGGTGLGLAISQKIIQAHNGRIWCTSSKGAGVSFHFTLPLVEGSFTDSESCVLPTAANIYGKRIKDSGIFSEGTTSTDREDDLLTKVTQKMSYLGRELKVLIVDDDSVCRSSILSMVSSFGDPFKTRCEITVSIGLNAEDIEMLKDEFDLVITDVDLGDQKLNGFEVVMALRAQGMTQSLICVHSNRFLENDMKTALTSGADAFIPKPMVRRHLLSLVNASLDKVPVVKAKIAQMGRENFEDLEEGEVARKGAQNTSQTQGDAPTDLPVVALVEDSRLMRSFWTNLQASAVDWEFKVFESPGSFLLDLPQFSNRLLTVVTDLYFDPVGGSIAKTNQGTVDGLELAKILRRRFPNIRVFLSSDGSLSSSQEEGWFDKILEKRPLTPGELGLVLRS